MDRETLNQLLSDCRERMTAIVAGAEAEERSAFTDAEQAEWAQLDTWAREAGEMLARLDAIDAIPGERQSGTFTPPNVNTRTSEDPFDLRDLPITATRSEVHGRVRTAIEQVRHLDDASREAATSLVERIDTRDARVAKHILATGSDAYRSAFAKLVSGEGHAITPEESRAVTEARAASLTDNAGGYAVPFTLDPTIIDTRTGVTNPVRAIARVVQTVTDSWNGVSSAGVTASWDAEAAEVSDDAPTLAQPSIPVHKAAAFVPFSIEIGQDWAAMESDVRTMIANSKDDLEGTAFTTGSGSGQPTGIVTALTGTASEINVPTTETFDAAAVYAVETALRPRSRMGASWLANKAVYQLIRQFDTGGGAQMWERIGAGQPPELLGYAAYEASAMDGSWSAAATANNYIMVLGNFAAGYVIADRIGLSVELIPHLFATGNNRPSGQRGFYAHGRVGADSVDDGAFTLLDLPTTA